MRGVVGGDKGRFRLERMHLIQTGMRNLVIQVKYRSVRTRARERVQTTGKHAASCYQKANIVLQNTIYHINKLNINI